MQIKIEAGILASALNKVISGCKNRQFSILSCVHITAKDNRIHLLTTDIGALTLRYSAECEVKEEGSVLVDADSLLKAAQKLDPDYYVDLKKDGTVLSVKCDKYKLSLPLSDLSEYPPVEGMDDVSYSIKCKANDLKKALAQVSASMCTDSTRPDFNGALLTLEQNSLNLNVVTTDGHRLTFAQVPVGVENKDAFENGVILAADGVRFMSKAFMGDVSLALHKGKIVATDGELTARLGLVSGAFPDFSKVIPTACEVVIWAERKKLIALTKRVLDFASKTGTVRLDVDRKKLTASANNMGKEVQDMVECESVLKFSQTTIGINGKFLLDALSSVDADDVFVSLNDMDSPVLILGRGDNTKFIIMPMQLS